MPFLWHMRHVVLSVLFLFGAMCASAQDTLKVLSWNIYMLPSPVFVKTKKMKRARLIAEKLDSAAYDVIVFQEAFHPVVRGLLRRRLRKRYPYQVGPANYRPLLIKTSSGVWMLSKWPMKKAVELQYDDCAGFADCMARKGVLVADLDWKGKQIQVIGTHIQAGDAKGMLVKESQYRQLGGLIRSLSVDSVPQVVCGDFNMRRANEERYARMLEDVGVEDYCLDGDEYTVHGKNGFKKRPGYQNEIDFIYLRPNHRLPEHVCRRKVEFKHPWSADNHDLSNHYAVECTMVFR